MNTFFRAFLVLALAFLAAPLVHATDLRITCTGPTQYTDNTAIPSTKVKTYALYGALRGQTKQQLDPLPGATASTVCDFTRRSVAVGTQEYYVTAIVDGVESDPSITVSAIVSPPKPNPPTNTAVVQLVAYEMRGTAADGNLRMVSVGYVAEGTQCMQTQATVSGVTYQQVAKQSVDLYNALNKLPPVTWARCG